MYKIIYHSIFHIHENLEPTLMSMVKKLIVHTYMSYVFLITKKFISFEIFKQENAENKTRGQKN